MKLKSLLISGLIITNFIIFSGCNKQNNTKPESHIYDQIPDQIGDGFQTAHISTVGLDESLIALMLNDISDSVYQNIHSILIVKDDKLVFEEYFEGEKFEVGKYTGEYGYTIEDKHNQCSATKSFVSALVGIAIDKGFISDEHAKVFSFFPEYSDLLVNDPEKNNLTLKHLLIMSSGLDWDDESTSYYDPQNDMYQLFISSDPIRYILSKDLHFTPGTRFEYQNCNTNVLGEIIHKASNLRFDEFAETYLFGALGTTEYEWQMIKNNVVFVSGELKLRPRDMAKFGYLFLKNGIWNGKNIISGDWIEESTEERFAFYNNRWEDGYGYQWWLKTFVVNNHQIESFFAQGWGGQIIFVFPEFDMVVVFTGGNYYEQSPIEEILNNYILRSVSS